MQPTTQQTMHRLPSRQTRSRLDIHELMSVTQRLGEVLRRETEHLKRMEVGELAGLQQEKLQLTQLLETYQTMFEQQPELLASLDDATRESIVLAAEDFTRTVDDNFRRTAVARAVNQRIVQAILDVVSEQQHAGTYTKNGYAGRPTNLAVSMNLNQKA